MMVQKATYQHAELDALPYLVIIYRLKLSSLDTVHSV